MVSPPYVVVGGSYGVTVAEVEKPALPEVFHIDDLLDFSCEDIGGPIVGGGELQLSGITTVENSQVSTRNGGGETSISSSTPEVKSESVEPVPVETEAKTDLCVPCDDLADLEWLSSFVEDSFTMVDTPDVFSQYGGPFASGNSERTKPSDDPYQKSSPVSVLETSATSSELTGQESYRDVSVPGRARSKRSRTGARIWTSRMLPTSSSVTSFDSMGADSYAMSYSPLESEDASGESTVDAVEEEQEEDEDSQCSKRYKLSHNQKSTITNKGGTRKKNHDNPQQQQQPWRCMHCQTQRTPQWRTGPMGPKTLCNACGVRYKSGRLLPEYRPAGSPTYIASKHSHSHKKVLEMRRERELRGGGGQPQHHQSLPLREKTNLTPKDLKKSSSMSKSDDYQSSYVGSSKCFSKPMEIPRPPKLEIATRYETTDTSGVEFSKCLDLGPRLDFGLDDTSMRNIRGL